MAQEKFLVLVDQVPPSMPHVLDAIKVVKKEPVQNFESLVFIQPSSDSKFSSLPLRYVIYVLCLQKACVVSCQALHHALCAS